jgi:AcrR family transcriptional regulator
MSRGDRVAADAASGEADGGAVRPAAGGGAPVGESESAPRRRGRPRGTTAQGEETRRRLYETATRLISERGWQATTLRDVAQEAGVSVGLLYRYFPSKQAIVLTLYDELSTEYAARAAEMAPGRWRDRFLQALTTSLDVLRPHRGTLSSLVPVLVGDAEEGLFSPRTAFSRARVTGVFVQAVVGASDAPRGRTAPALGRLLYLVHLAILLWWLLDKSPSQRATAALVRLLTRAAPLISVALRVPTVPGLVVAADALVRDALLDDAP